MLEPVPLKPKKETELKIAEMKTLKFLLDKTRWIRIKKRRKMNLRKACLKLGLSGKMLELKITKKKIKV